MRKTSNGFVHVLLLVGVILVGIIGIGYFAYRNTNTNTEAIEQFQLTTTPTINRPYGWNIYSNKTFKNKFSFNYPPDYEIFEDSSNKVVIGAKVPPSSNNKFPILTIYPDLQIDTSKLVPCPAHGGISPCLSDMVGNTIKNIQVDGKNTKGFYVFMDLGNNAFIKNYHIIQFSEPKLEIAMDSDDGRDRIFDQILSTFKFTN